MKFISSRDNPLVKRLVRLSQGRAEKVQSAQGRAYRMVLEGEHLCLAWLEHQSQPELMIVSESRAGQPAIVQLAGRIEAERIVCLPDALFKSISNVENGQGVIFLAVAPQPVRPQRIIETSLWLDRIQDPGNVGTLLRTAAAAGIRHVYLAAGSAAVWSAKVLRSAQGAHFVLAIHEMIYEGAANRVLKAQILQLRKRLVPYRSQGTFTPEQWLEMAWSSYSTIIQALADRNATDAQHQLAAFVTQETRPFLDMALLDPEHLYFKTDVRAAESSVAFDMETLFVLGVPVAPRKSDTDLSRKPGAQPVGNSLPAAAGAVPA